ncbi:hypothetical protein STRCI_008043 [Streptomyces cinnabarinus]|uniref:GAF domain-containing protein n=1 Tax=Streptomyces cinnabarinus TaxID=67287 RepID=A0ABY7KSF6_9ACTN|nr:hypothetical protein [Streptomyces cinnabarinus]WAZ26463.1 hypothetical protein STRCI_008043 [Streptomyces cinnabarinus]
MTEKGVMSIRKDRKWARRVLVAVSVAAPGVTFLCGTQAARTHGAARITFIVIGVLSTVVTPFVAHRAQKRDRTATVVEIEAASAAVADHLGLMVTVPGERTKYCAKIESKLVQRLADHAAPKQARCSYYALTPSGQLELAEATFNAAPRSFDPSVERQLLNLDRIRYVPDNQDDDDVKVSLGGGHRSVVVAPVCAGSQPQGVLVIDAPRKGSLNKATVRESYVRAVASLLGTAGAMKAEPTVPPVIPGQPGGEPDGENTATSGREG